MKSLGLLCALWLTTSIAQAGVYIETVNRDSKSGASEPAERWYVQDGNARIEGADGISIFKGGVVYAVDKASKSYHIMDRPTIEKLGARMKEIRAQREQQMKADLAKMPPQQRKQVEEMMAKQGMDPDAKPSKRVVDATDTGKTESINGRSCHVWDITRDGALDQQYCVAAFASVPGGSEVQTLMQNYQSFFQQMSEMMAGAGGGSDSMRDEFELWKKLGGYPIATRGYAGSKLETTETVVKTWQVQAVPAAMFEVPSDYTKRDLLKDLEGAKP
ncbi:MAG TPA: hypothetical protein VEZ88_13245 [Steroidobacteraceae bacterium]|nr:hypothetical protein [Steroidobacteraceae bacterium]